MGWVSAGDYEVALDDGKVVCRNAAGRRLKSVPSKIADHAAVVGLRQLTEWLERHERQCLADVERWMVRSLPVPFAVVVGVWADPAWQAALRDLVVTGADGEVAGFLRDADPERGLGLVDLDGDSVRITPDLVRLPHPVLLDDLEELREFAAELEVTQRAQQLFREVWHRPAALDAGADSVEEYAGGRFKEQRFLHGRASQLGYRVRGGNAVCSVLEDDRTVEARVWVGDYEGYEESETGPLVFTDDAGRVLKLGQVGPVAWSEGMRMAAALYAGRDIEDEERAA
ncbi:DUF4132 domain-containing protein [Streptomyces antibioticus]|uniref:DUF4132 domain-containing protein n=1 Tax=Streptomyces antibioticus TaxID=1890 RepID=A0AAE6Y4R0_STRAT|nr:DUF4132 domain-containing protein [Streptomyces antibioticus]MCX5167291.1 DUF4132 domain-containing protein [Streptomyces antibioticus]OOQ55243.1 hypothetical protein AFM16_04330 [Streptomyces antibioticus]QIT42882.1 DUF4132 domain-containing protein [Streptomyces antibioticus]